MASIPAARAAQIGLVNPVGPGGEVLAEAGDTEETILYAEIDPAAADRNLVVRMPGEWEFDRIASRRPEMYEPITQRK